MIDIFIYLLILLVLFISYLLYHRVNEYFYYRRWEFIKKKIFPAEYEKVLSTIFHPYKYLSVNEKKNLQLKILYFLEYKNISAVGDFVLTEPMKLMIAAQACLLIINIENKVYASLKNIFVFATTFVEKENMINVQTMRPSYVPRLGESWLNGPVVLSWSSVKEGFENWRDGHNVVLHEFTHQLDNSEGAMNGVPPLIGANASYKWKILMTKDFLELNRKVKLHIQSDIDTYGSINPMEFFAVSVEEFFEEPYLLMKKHPKLFVLYKDYFKIDPRKWSKKR